MNIDLQEKLDELFPKHKSKERGQAMLLLAFAQMKMEQLKKGCTYNHVHKGKSMQESIKSMQERE